MDNPIDPEPFLGEPCSVFDVDALEVAGFEILEVTPEPKAPVGPTCQWIFDPRSDGSFSGIFGQLDEQGVSSVYAQRDSLDLFEELDPIEGHPIVAYSQHDGRESGRCSVAVGLRDDFAYDIGVTAIGVDNEYSADPCGTAHELAGLAIETMTEGEE
ncbi:Protein of unknown function [Haloechinothrix alba]|uniref:DUF3558 domain-containing protein n=1 Tax=Haloechinothrix alba TaxID=664784 RepID=A0A238VQN3_9PSEU|nr:Protein of unknown function [Haloechinothrix alba]